MDWRDALNALGVFIIGVPFTVVFFVLALIARRIWGGDTIEWMVGITLTFLLFFLLGCAPVRRPCFTTLELSVYGSESDGTSAAVGERWENDDVTVGGSATMTFDFTGACEWESSGDE